MSLNLDNTSNVLPFINYLSVIGDMNHIDYLVSFALERIKKKKNEREIAK